MTTTLNGVNFCPGIATNHFARKIGRQQIRIRTTDNEDRRFDRRPVFPDIDAVVPRVAKGANDLRVAEHDVTLATRVPCNAVAGYVAPMLVDAEAISISSIPSVV